MPSHDADVRRRLEGVLLAAAAVCGLWVATTWLRAVVYRAANSPAIEAAAAPEAEAAAPAAGPSALAPGEVVGLLEIPSLRFSEVVAEGDTEATLRVAIGHLPDTPLPWIGGNSVLAGHRDTHFRVLQRIAVGDLIRLKTIHGAFEYTVREKIIVNPEDVWVLAPAERPLLTLVTCYPFSYVGPAPQRFIVRAERAAGRGET